MEVKLDNLIEKIKKEGIEEAKTASQEILAQANQDAEKIKQAAGIEAKEIISRARRECQQLTENARGAIAQAARDTVLTIKEELKRLLDKIFKRRIAEELTPEFTKDLIIQIVNKWSPKQGVVLEVHLSSKDKHKLEALIISSLKGAAKDTIEIKVADRIDRGFRIGVKGEDAFYDFSEETILATLKEFLNPALAAILENSNE